MFWRTGFFECVAKINIIYKLMLWSITQNRTNKCDLLKKTMSPSQWQLSGSCLPLLCSLVHTLRMPHFKGDLKIQVRTQNENAKLFNQSQYFTIWLGRTAFRATVFATDGTARTASLRRQPTKPSKNQIESSSVCTETGESSYQVK